MKYCEKCGAEMNDDALFCSKCGAKVSEVAKPSEPKEMAPEKPAIAVNEKPAEEIIKEKPVEEAPKRAARKAAPLYEQKVKELLPVSLAAIGCSLIMWIITATVHPTGILHIMPFIIFMIITAFLAVMSMIRAVKTLTRKIFFNSVLSFVLFGLLVTTFIINFIFLIVG